MPKRTGRPKRIAFDAMDAKLAVAVGLGLTIDAACEFVGCSRQTYYDHEKGAKELFDEFKSYGVALAEKTIAHRLTKSKAIDVAGDKILARFDRALAITDRLFKKLEVMEREGKEVDEASFDQLLEGHKHLTKWISQYAASKAPTRVSLTGEFLLGHVVLHDETVDSITDYLGHLRERLAPAVGKPLIELTAHEPAPATE